jgi:hypothetical protein
MFWGFHPAQTIAEKARRQNASNYRSVQVW